MNPWPYVGLSVLGTIGMVVAMKPWYDELNKIVEREEATGRSTTLRERIGLIFWVVPATGFGIVGLIGGVGLLIYFSRSILQA